MFHRWRESQVEGGIHTNTLTFTRSDSLLNNCRRRKLHRIGSKESSVMLCVTIGGRLDRCKQNNKLNKTIVIHIIW